MVNKLNHVRGIGGTHNKERQEDDYYATPPRAINGLLSKVDLSKNVWEVACGGGHLSDTLIDLGYNVVATDIKDRGAKTFTRVHDFLNDEHNVFDGDIVTNPPYKFATEFVQESLDTITDGHKVCMFLKIQFLEGAKRFKELYKDNSLKQVLVYSSRIGTAKNADFDKYKSTAMCHAWFVWEKGYKGLPTIDWLAD